MIRAARAKQFFFVFIFLLSILRAPTVLADPSDPGAAREDPVKPPVRTFKWDYAPAKRFATLAAALELVQGVDPKTAEAQQTASYQLLKRLVQFADQVRAGFERPPGGIAPENWEPEREFATHLNAGEIKLRADPEGVGELNAIDNREVHRIIPNGETLQKGSELAIFFIPDAEIHQKSRHLYRVLAGQHLRAGRSRSDGEDGRDVLVVRHNKKGEVLGVDFFPRYKKYSKAWWNDLRLYLDRPNLELSMQNKTWLHILCMGIAVGGFLQMNIVVNVKLLELMHPNQTALLHAASAGESKLVLTGIFGTLCGVYAVQIRKLIDLPKPPIAKMMMQIAITSLPYGLVYKALDPDSSWQGWATLVDLAANIFINNAGRNQFYQLTAMLNHQRKNVGEFLGSRVADWQNQIFSIVVLMPWRLLDLGGAWAFSMMLGGPDGFRLSGAKFIMLGIWPTTQYIFTRVAERMNAEQKDLIRLRWETSIFALPLGVPLGTAADLSLYAMAQVAKLIEPGIDADIHLYRLVDRINRQKWAIPFHLGSLANVVGKAASFGAMPFGPRGRCGAAISSFGKWLQKPLLKAAKSHPWQ